MLRVQLLGPVGVLTLKLEGRFAGADAEHTRMLIARSPVDVRLVVDLTDVVFVDAIGENVLLFLGRLGAEFVASTSYTFDVCERLRLPLARTASSTASTSGLPSNNGRSRLDAPKSKKDEC